MSTPGKARRFVRALATRTLEFELERVPFRLEHISRKKLMAVAMAELNSARARPRPPWYPVQLQIETSASCTLRCPLCPAAMGVSGEPRGNMSFQTFQSLMDEVGDHAVLAILWMWGEPFVNPKLCEMIEYAHDKNVATVVSTNGQHVETKEDAERVVASGLDNLIVAVDGATQETYARYRVGGNLQKVLRCLELIGQAKRSLGSEKPLVNVRTVVMKHNEHELPEIEGIARRYGADAVSMKTAHMPDYCGDDADERFAPDDERYRRCRYVNGKRVRRPASEVRCLRPWRQMSVAADGTVLSCEFDFDRRVTFGRIGNGSTAMQAWRSETAAAFRRQFWTDKAVYPFCADCHYRDRHESQSTVELRHLKCPTSA